MSRPSTRQILSRTLPQISDSSDDESEDQPTQLKAIVATKISDISLRVSKSKELGPKDKKKISDDLIAIQQAVNSLASLTSPKQAPLDALLNKILTSVNETNSHIQQIKSQPSPSSYANAAKLPKIHGKSIPTKGIVPLPTNKVTIFPAEGNSKITTSDETKAALTLAINPRSQQIKPDKITRIPNKGICIESHSPNINKIINAPELKKAGLIASTPTKFNPRLAIYFVPKNQTAEDLLTALQEYSTSNDEIRIISKFGKRDAPTNHWVIETTPEIRAELIKAGRIYVGWSSCRIEDHVRVIRCFNCQKLGHQSSQCKSDTTCGHCGEKHKTEDCPKKENSPSCANCMRSGSRAATDHQAWSKKCPTFLRRLEAHISNINYGQE